MITKPIEATASIKATASNSRGLESGFKAAQALVAATPTHIGLWDLETTHTEEKPPEAAFYRPNSLQVDESVVGGDARVLVKEEEFAEGGKYRAVVKLMARMEGHDAKDPWMMGTGWLIAPDLIVTAGHMSFDWDHKFGFVKELKAWIGYYGRDNVGDTSVQLRHGETVAVPAEWIKAPRENYDVSFVKIDKPFTGIEPIVYSDTPAKGTLNLGVVGYPGDLLSPGDVAYGEHMYEMYLPTDFDLATSNRLLQYQIDTFGGNSGSPVFVRDDMKAIGVHVLGGEVNSASVIGPLGNIFEVYKGSFLANSDPAFDITTTIPSRVKSFRLVSVPSKNERDSKYKTVNQHTTTESLTDSSTSLFGSLRSLLDSTIRAHDDPEHLLGKLHSLLEPSMVNAMSDACNGAAGFVTALQFLWESNKDSPTNTEALLTTLAKHKSTATRVGKAVIEHKGTILKVGKTIGERSPAGMVLKYGFDAASEIASSNDESLMDHIATGLSVTVPMVDKELPKLGSIGRPIATMAASALRSVGSQAAAAVSSDSEPSSPSPESSLVQEGVLPGANERAILAETALHGIMHLGKSVLKQHRVYDKMHAIIKPLAPTIKRADSMLSSIMQPTITKVALASLNAPNVSSEPSHGATYAPQGDSDASQNAANSAPGTPAASKSPTFDDEALTDQVLGGSRPHIGVTVPSQNILTPQIISQDSTAVDEPIAAFTEALMTANPDLEDILAGVVNRGMQLRDGSFSNVTMFGLPILLGDGQESEYEYEHAESAVAITGLAHRAMLAEAALQVVLQLPVDVIKSLEVPDLKPTVDAFDTEKTEGLDESGQAEIPQYIAAGAATLSSAANSASAYLTHKDKVKDQEQKEQELALKRQDQAQAADALRVQKIGQNMQARKDGLEQPHKDVTRFHPQTGKAIEPGQPHLDDNPDGDGGGGHGRVSAPTRGGSHVATAQHPIATEGPEHHSGEEGPSEHNIPAEPSATSRGKQPLQQQKPQVPSKPPDIAAKLPIHPKPVVEPKPKDEEPKPKAEEPKPKAEEPHKVEEPPVAEHSTAHQTAPVHAGSASTKPKEGEPKEEQNPKAAHFSAPTASSAAKKTKPPVPAKPKPAVPAKEGEAVKRGGKRESLLVEDPESMIAEDFVSGFASS